ncbi:branched-chain amino acid ABC transporter permease [Streptomyces sp. NPDC048420]|uniref:branched-chain amino acid ABC transporter permease n=1 Tax=Streptomyces sp. NPDC048420 TaxID=3155755 RepID=UPI00341BC4E1
MIVDQSGGTRTESVRRRPATAAVRRWASGENIAASAVFVALFYVPYVFTGYPVFVLPQYMLFGVLAMSLCLLWGLGGMVSFGQAAFFIVGSYSMGIAVRDIAGSLGPWAGIAMGVAIAVAAAGAVGYFLFSARVRDSYFVLVTLAISTVAQVVANSASGLTGGFNGMFVPRVALDLPGLAISLESDLGAYYVIFLLTLLTYLGLRTLQRSAFGKVLVSIRENEERTESLGYNTALRKTLAFAIAGGVAALAGAFYATDAGFVSPDLGGVLFSTNVVVWVAIGGRQHLLGAIVGAIGISALSNQLNAWIPTYWQLLLGLLFFVVIAFFRRGLVGTVLAIRLPMRRAQ